MSVTSSLDSRLCSVSRIFSTSCFSTLVVIWEGRGGKVECEEKGGREGEKIRGRERQRGRPGGGVRERKRGRKRVERGGRREGGREKRGRGREKRKREEKRREREESDVHLIVAFLIEVHVDAQKLHQQLRFDPFLHTLVGNATSLLQTLKDTL